MQALSRSCHTEPQGTGPSKGGDFLAATCVTALQSTVKSKDPEHLSKSTKAACCSAPATVKGCSGKQVMLATRWGP